jgi:uncharacterized protein (TIGR03437 family)
MLKGCFVTLLAVSALGQTASQDPILSEKTLSFSAFDGGDAPPSAAFSITSSTDQALAYSVRVDGGSWLTARPAKGTTPARIQVSADQTDLGVGAYSANIVVSSPGSPDQVVTVTLAVAASPSALVVSPSLLQFEAPEGSNQTLQQGFFVNNGGGGGALNFEASVADGALWLTVEQESNQASPNSPAVVRVSVNPAGLAKGVYRGVVHVDSDAGGSDSPVSLVVGAPGPALGLNFNGLAFETREGNGYSNTRNVLVLNNGTGTVNWQTELLSGAEWLNLSSGSARGQATPENASRLSLTANPGSLAPGVYYALIRLSDPQALDSPQYFTGVLHVTAAAEPAGPDPTPQGLFFVSESGAPPPAVQPVRLFVSSQTPILFQASVSTVDGANWLTIDRTSGVTSTQNTAVLSVTADASQLPAGIYTGDVTVSFPNAGIRTTNITMVVPNSATAAASGKKAGKKERLAAGCVAARLSMTQTGLVNNFSAAAGWPQTLIVRLADDCGLPVLNAQMVATFSNGDPALPMALTNPQVGLYSATWSPTRPGAQVQATARASAPGLGASTAVIIGEVVPNQAPSLSPNSAVSEANPVPGAPLAPGGIATLTGLGLAAANLDAPGAPLPTSLNGTSVLIGAIEAPVFSVSPGQIRIQVPTGLDPNRAHSIVVGANGAYTIPDTINLVPAEPGISTRDGALAIAQSALSTPISAESPTHPGDQVTIFLEGMGLTTPPVESGTAADGPSGVQLTPTVSVNGEKAEIGYAGLTPGLIGVYEINLQIPADLAPGDVPVVVTQNGVNSNTAILPVR